MAEKLKTRRWNIQEHLGTEEEIQGFLQACFEEAGSDPAFIAKALGDVARARGMTRFARETGLPRDTLYKALSDKGNPSFGMVLKVCAALGIKLVPQPVHA